MVVRTHIGTTKMEPLFSFFDDIMFPRGFTKILGEFILVRPINKKVPLTKQPQTNPLKLMIDWFKMNLSFYNNGHAMSCDLLLLL